MLIIARAEDQIFQSIFSLLPTVKQDITRKDHLHELCVAQSIILVYVKIFDNKLTVLLRVLRPLVFQQEKLDIFRADTFHAGSV